MCNFYYSYPKFNYYVSKSYKNILCNIIKETQEEKMTKTSYSYNNSQSNQRNNGKHGSSVNSENKDSQTNNKNNNRTRGYHSNSDGSMLEYVYDLEDMNRRFSDYQERLGQLALLYDYDKIGFHEDKIYADRKSSFQFFRRWYYGQNREVTYINLKNLFDDYYIYINMVKSSLNMNNAESYVILGRAVHSFNYSLISGLDKLKKTYENEDEKLVLLIADIINNLRMLNSQISNTRIFTAFYPTPTSPSLTSTAPSKNNNGSAPSSPASTKL